MSDRVFTIEKVGRGELSIGPHPKSDELNDWADTLNADGVNHVTCLITQDEIKTYGIEDEVQTLVERGIGFTHFPIDDFQTPDAALFFQLIAELKVKLETGEHIFLHCAGGIGRAGTTASCLLVEFGVAPDDAMEKVSSARKERCPETPDQVAFVRSWGT